MHDEDDKGVFKDWEHHDDGDEFWFYAVCIGVTVVFMSLLLIYR